MRNEHIPDRDVGKNEVESCSWERGRNNSRKSRHETPLTEHHSWNMAVEPPENVTHEMQSVETESHKLETPRSRRQLHHI